MKRSCLIIVACSILFVSVTLTQTSLQKYEQNPILTPSPGAFDQSYAFDGYVLKEGSGFRMWYTGFGGDYSIGEASSPDEIHWTKYSLNPVLPPGPPGTFDETGPRVSSVLKDPSGYKMYYYAGSGLNLRVGLATSTDGYSWVKYSQNPILKPDGGGAWESIGTWNAMVIQEDALYKMWYQGWDGQHSSIGYATSGDGIHWSRYQNNPVMSHGEAGSFDEITAGAPRIVKEGTNYHMYYTGVSSAIVIQTGYAHSTDGIHWEKSVHNPVLSPGPAAWDSYYSPVSSALLYDNQFHVWYSGYGQSGTWQMGYATSTVSDGNPPPPAVPSLAPTGLIVLMILLIISATSTLRRRNIWTEHY
ncbi:MAG: hypothetical protein HY033_09500 [Ignavibacteriae bacterium]|nr:hypothetical protein [Ignavibacteria bacterium]MBI3365128.1 hypothetical protein [Ignavibacteriota bacterium]